MDMDVLKSLFNPSLPDVDEIMEKMADDPEILETADEYSSDDECNSLGELEDESIDELVRSMKRKRVHAYVQKKQKAARTLLATGDRLCVQKSAMSAMVKEILGPDLNVSAEAGRILHIVSEAYLSELFEKSYILSRLNGRKTVNLSDIRGTLALGASCFKERQAILEKEPTFQREENTETGEAEESGNSESQKVRIN